jgi:hypothetical protein
MGKRAFPAPIISAIVTSFRVQYDLVSVEGDQPQSSSPIGEVFRAKTTIIHEFEYQES